ncbi:Sodium/hydrogen exchanger [Myriangium duriaei CBS 260.36]|uniref:Sodium/hydrogen exchanger n=1 Tax=Myriangium duriaei CBS 260.36 TaxID=1168546 RepID=A0A9P4IWQ8_9PEZI|nr:Sodium/hydrogen exchanger [Myriangium duriaei CBS 260.36]
MAWEQIEATPAHKSYLLLSSFLILYTLFATFVRNRLHLSEPPLALIVGILLGPKVLDWLNPNQCNGSTCLDEVTGNSTSWGWGDDVLQEITRVIVGLQVFTVGITLPRYYATKHWKSVAMLLGPVMTFGWIACAVIVYFLFQTNIPTALVISACLTPTDPVLSASILSNSQFSSRVPSRIRNMLAAESGCNDGVSFPFLYVGLYALLNNNFGDAAKDYFLITILWQCVFGTLVGLIIGTVFNYALRFSEKRGYTDDAGLTVFYLLLAILCVGTGSILGSDDFLVAFGAGYGFARDGWFTKKIKSAHLPDVIDLLLNSAMFVYFGTIIPWDSFDPKTVASTLAPWKIVLFAVLVLLFRRIPIVLATYKFIPDIQTFREALFCGWFGPMGLGGLFLAMEARAMLETESSIPLPHPPKYQPPLTSRQQAIELIWPVVSSVVVASTLVHGLSVLALSIGSHLRRHESERAPLLAAETDPLTGMVHEDSDYAEDD